MRLENRNDILYLDKIKFKSVKDNKVDYTCEKMVEIETAEELEILLTKSMLLEEKREAKKKKGKERVVKMLNKYSRNK